MAEALTTHITNVNLLALIKKYFVKPIADFYALVVRAREISASIHVAGELRRMGMHKEADEILDRIRDSR